MAVIGSVILGADPNISDVEHFYTPKHRRCYEIIMDLYVQGQPLEPTSILTAGFTDAPFLLSCTEATTVDAGPHYATILREKWRLRQLQVLGQKLIQAATSTDADVDHVTSLIEMFHAENPADTNLLQFSQLADEWQEWRESDTVRPIRTPWLEVNSKIAGGWQKGRLYVVGARPGAGKSVMGVNAVAYAAQNNHPCLIFSVEMPRLEIASRLLASSARVDYGAITRHEFSSRADTIKVDEFIAKNRGMKLWIYDDPGVSIESIVTRCRSLKKKGLELVMIDYAQLIKPSDSRVSRQEQVSHIARQAKLMAMELDIAVIMAAQLNRGADDEVDGKVRLPQKRDLRESGELENSADVVMLLQRVREEATIQVVFAKNRSGQEGQTTLVERFDQARIDG